MLSIVPFNEDIITNSKLPIEIIKHVFTFNDICSHIITIGKNCINIYDFNTNEIIKTIDTFNVLHMSVSKCFKYIVGSNDSRLCIWNLEDLSLVQDINFDYTPDLNEDTMRYYSLSNHGESIHTFTSNNNLLIGFGHKVKSYILEKNIWIENDQYELPYEHCVIACITANTTTDLIACGDLYGSVYIYNLINKNLVHKFTTRSLLVRTDHASAITSIAFNENILVVSSIGRNHILLNLSTMQQIRIEEPDRYHNGSYFYIKNYMLTPCLTKFIGTIYDRTYLWDAINGRVIKRLKIVIEDDCSFSPKGKYIVSNGRRYGIQKFEYNNL